MCDRAVIFLRVFMGIVDMTLQMRNSAKATRAIWTLLGFRVVAQVVAVYSSASIINGIKDSYMYLYSC
jgi:hypothetical protein